MPEPPVLDKAADVRCDPSHRNVGPGFRGEGTGQKQREEVARRLVVLLGRRRLEEVAGTQVLAHEKCVRSRDVASNDPVAFLSSKADHRFETCAEEIGSVPGTVGLVRDGQRQRRTQARVVFDYRRTRIDGIDGLPHPVVVEIDVDAQKVDFAGEIDLLSIDIDFNDYWVWKAVNAVNPRAAVIEYNAGLRPPLSLTVPYQPNRSGDGTNFFGASLEAMVRLGAQKGYRIVGCNISGSNAFFVREDLCAGHFLEPATAEEHYEPPRHFFSLLLAGPLAPKPGPYVAV